MPITQIIDDIDNLIGSGASPAKLRAQLATLRDQAGALQVESDNFKLKAENPEIERKCKELEAEVESLKLENQRLRDTIASQDERDQSAESAKHHPIRDAAFG